ncbi:MAG: alpha/beta hydrolase [Sphingomonadaceae bacterium]|nr:alpha/beta hydrolase [Sphingomonadaceae bacterium]
MDKEASKLPWGDHHWTSPDGLSLHYRDYAGPDGALPVLCLHGLTRNARDFEALAAHLAGRHRVIVPELRGRGDSEYARDAMSYTPATYIEDIEALLAELALGRFVAVGTSLGGLLTMLLASRDASRIAGAVLNDIGPAIEAEGLERIRDYVGQGRSFPTWMHAARALQETHGHAFPDYEIDQWIGMAKRCMVIGQSGRIAFDYDMAVAEPFNQPDGEAGVDLWPALEALSHCPVAILRGEFSDVLSEATLQEMLRRLPLSEAVSVPRVGHAPMLDEEAALAGIDALLERVQ